MAMNMIFKYEGNSKSEIEKYEEKIDYFADMIVSNFFKGKKLLIITGSGISDSVPGMNEIMNKLIELIKEYDDTWIHSSVFEGIYQDYINTNTSEKHQMQSRILTYIQNAYMGKSKYVQKEDLVPLSEIWAGLVQWLVQGGGKYAGLISAQHSQQHKLIRDLYKEIKAVSITTNFDNLLHKAFDRNDNFYPILDTESFDKYYLSEEDDNSYIEIQSRGDAFWLECTGTKNKICPNRHRQCYVPGNNVKVENGHIKCNLCDSEAKIYFAFPGTKEKDAEMSLIIDGIWKYLANSISCVLVIGNSMDYDPVLVEFLREMIQKRKTPIMYISRYKGSKEYTDIFDKEATKFLFSNLDFNNIWTRAKKTEDVLSDLLARCKERKTQYQIEKIRDNDNELKFYKQNVKKIFGEKKEFEEIITSLQAAKYLEGEILEDGSVRKMQHFSQLGLKTYWLQGKNMDYQEHNRFKHSIGVMLIASYLYLQICNAPNRNELQFLQLAALFHDLGHLPFSHLLEEVFDEFGWIPVGENTTFNHEQHTKYIIEDIVKKNSTIKSILGKINYSSEELQYLINGEFGKGYLDALINSPLDCDKIEYLFSDAIFMKRGTKEDFDSFINEFVENLTVNTNDFLILKKNSTCSFLNLIKMRGEMYDQVYLRSGLRYLECCCKLIIRTFIVYECTKENVFTSIINRGSFKEYYNLSDSKIQQTINFIENCLGDLHGDKVCELHVLEKMVLAIKKNQIISGNMKNTVEFCFELIKNTTSDKAVKEIEAERILTFKVANKNINRSTLKDLLKNIYLRFPGVILLDYVESKTSFSFGKREMRKRRRDGTRSATENILIKDIKQIKGYLDESFKCLGDATEDVNKELHYSDHSYINIYRISDNLFYYMQAEDYIIHELKKEGVIHAD